MPRLSRRRPALALAQPATAVELQEDTRRVLERRDKSSGRLQVSWRKDAADGAAGTTTGETLIWSNPPGGSVRKLEGATFTPAANVVASSSNFARIRLRLRPADGSASKHIATASTATKQWRAWVPVPFALDGKPPLIEPGASLTLIIDKPGTGVILPAGTLLAALVDG